MHYYPFNIADYRKKTTHLSPVEHYIYRSLLDWIYLDEKPIPAETRLVLRRLSLGSEHEEKLTNVLQDFFTLTDDGWKNGRAEREIEAYHTRAEVSRNNGRNGGRPKKQQLTNIDNPKKTQQVSDSIPAATGQKGNQEPRTNNQEPITKEGPGPRKRGSVLLSTYLKECEQQGTKPVPKESAVFKYAEDVSIPPEYLALAWKEFKDRSIANKKKYKSWPLAFLNCVRDNWYGLWWVSDEGEYALTSKGKQAEKAHE